VSRIALRKKTVAAMLALGLPIAVGACGDEGEGAPPETRFAAALATVSGHEPLGIGYGWIDVERLRQARGAPKAQLAWAADALGPGARQIAAAARSIDRTGVAPLEAQAMLSIATSYTLALRLDGVDPTRAEAALARAGAQRRRGGGWKTFNLGAEWSAPLGSSLEPLGSLAARSATRDSTIVLARSNVAREEMTSTGDPASEVDSVAVAAGCLGDVVAARLVLDNHTHLPNVGPDLLAFGVLAESSGPPREVLCAIGEPKEPVDAAAQSLEEAFEPGARDAITGEPMGTLVASSEVEAFEQDGLQVARAKLVAPAGAEPGLLFRAFDRGSMLTYLGLQPPPARG
jgi:hypothetical protein